MASFGGGNPILSPSAQAWDDLIEAVGPASILVVIDTRMSDRLKRHIAPEDVWQETLLHAWRDRIGFEWRGLKSFRSWLLTIIDNRLRDLSAHHSAQKRGGDAPPVAFSVLERSGSQSTQESGYPGPIGSTTPSRIAMYKEQAAAMEIALETLPEDLRCVVRFRLFEQLPVEEIAERLGIGVSAVRHRFRKGAEIYRRRLRAALASRSRAFSSESTNTNPADSSP